MLSPAQDLESGETGHPHVEKGHLRTRRVGTSFLYRPSRTIHRALRDSADQLLDQVVPGALGPLIQYMVGKSRLSEIELDELKEVIGRPPREPMTTWVTRTPRRPLRFGPTPSTRSSTRRARRFSG